MSDRSWENKLATCVLHCSEQLDVALAIAQAAVSEETWKDLSASHQPSLFYSIHI